jgi:hypothetical protein
MEEKWFPHGVERSSGWLWNSPEGAQFKLRDKSQIQE